MPKAKKTETKKHNWVTGPNNKIVKADEDRAAYLAICGCRHLTPASEAMLDNLLGVEAHVPTQAEVIARNMPGFEEVEVEVEVDAEDIPVNWMDVEPTAAELAEIEAGS